MEGIHRHDHCLLHGTTTLGSRPPLGGSSQSYVSFLPGSLLPPMTHESSLWRPIPSAGGVWGPPTSLSSKSVPHYATFSVSHFRRPTPSAGRVWSPLTSLSSSGVLPSEHHCCMVLYVSTLWPCNSFSSFASASLLLTGNRSSFICRGTTLTTQPPPDHSQLLTLKST